MQRQVFNNPTFCFLKAEHTNEGLVISGETKEGLNKEDEIQNPNDGKQFLPIKEIIERRDSRNYPAGNNYFFKVLC
jgi:hypothetical protein